MVKMKNMEEKTRLQEAVLNINNKTFPIYGGVNTIGRDKDAIINIKHVNISKFHAIIFVLKGQHYISDLNSSNGCSTENTRMVPFQIYQLKNNSQVTIGGLEGTYVSEAPFADNNESSCNDTPTQSFYECGTQLLESSITQNIHEAATQEISWAWAKPRQILARDKDPIEKPKKTTMDDDDDDEITDCEDNLEEIIPNNITKQDENSNDSMDFLKDNQHRESKKSDTEEDFTIKRTKKSIMVISTQDIGSDSFQEAERKRASFGINDTIPATQNESAMNMDDSDIIPSTQQAVKHPNKPTNWSQESFRLELTELMEGSPEENNCESAKSVGEDTVKENGTQKVTQKIDNHDIKNNTASHSDTEECIYDLSTQKTNMAPINAQKIKQVSDNTNVNSETENIFNASIQKVNLNASTHDREVIHDLTTQKVTINYDSDTETTQKVDVQDQEDNIYDLATQNISYHFEDNEIASLAPVNTQDYQKISTQKIDNVNLNSETKNISSQKASIHEEDVIHDLTTQKVANNYDSESETTQVLDIDNREDDIYDLATQKIKNYEGNQMHMQDDDRDSEGETIFHAPTQKVHFKGPTDDQEGNIYDLATQKTNNYERNQMTKQDDDRDSETETTFHAPTQKVHFKVPTGDQEEDIYDLPTQRISCHIESKEVPITTEVDDDEDSEVEAIFKAPAQKGNQEEDIYDLPTQKIGRDIQGEEIHSVAQASEVEAIFKAPTEKEDQEEDIYDVATQKISRDIQDKEVHSLAPITKQADGRETEVEAIFKAPTQKVDQEEDIYDLATQKISFDVKSNANKQADSGSSDEDIVFNAPTQKVKICTETMAPQTPSVVPSDSETEVYDHTSQKINNENVKTPHSDSETSLVPDLIDAAQDVTKATNIENDTVQEKVPQHATRSTNRRQEKIPKPDEPKKKFSFKKKQCNLNASLSTLVDNNKQETSSSSNDTNKLFAILESKCTKTKKSKETSEVQVTVPRGRRTMTLSLRDEDEASTKTNARKKRGEQKAPPVRKSSRNSTKTVSINNNEVIEVISVSKLTGKRRASSSSTSSSIATTPQKKQKIELTEATPSTSQASSKSTGKRRVSSSSSSTYSSSITATPQKKQKNELTEATLSTPQRGLRKQKPKVVFTMLDNPQLESLIKQLGGSIVDSVEACTVLVTEHVKRSQKLLSAIGLGKPICSPKWITESKKNQEFLDPWDYLLTDPEAEKKWEFSLKESFRRSREDKLLNSHSFYIQISNGAEVLKGAIESCGGKCLPKFPTPPPEDTYIISSLDNRSKYSRIIKKYPNIKVLEAEAIFDGVLRQELRFSRHTINN